MSDIKIFGHKKPDTDSVAASISLSYLKNILGYKTTPYVLGRINNETKYLLEYFNIKTPKYLNDVKLQVKDIKYYKNYFLEDTESIYETYLYMKDKNITGLPIVDHNQKILGLVTNKDILEYILGKEDSYLETSYQNIIDVTGGKEVLKFDEEIIGEIISPSYFPEETNKNYGINKDSILVLGNHNSIIKQAIKSAVKMIIIVDTQDIEEEYIELAKEKNINIITTTKNVVETTRNLIYSNYIRLILGEEQNIFINHNDYYNDFMDIHDKYRYTNYPIIDSNNRCLGLLRTNNLRDKERKKVILVDHNELLQSVDGIEEAEILELVDHHKLGNFSTINPIEINVMPVGSTNTIIYNMYQKEKVTIPKEIAGIMMGAIISDTLLFKSPTTTKMDIQAVKDLEKICGVNHYDLGISMLKAGASLKGKNKEEVLYSDFKGFVIDDKRIGIGQVNTLDFSVFEKDIPEYVTLLNNICNQEDYSMLLLFVTDILSGGSYIIYNEAAKRSVEIAFEIDNVYEGYFLKGYISRKKQVIPKIMESLEKGR